MSSIYVLSHHFTILLKPSKALIYKDVFLKKNRISFTVNCSEPRERDLNYDYLRIA